MTKVPPPGVTQAQRETLELWVRRIRTNAILYPTYLRDAECLEALLRDHARLVEERELARIKAGTNPLQHQLLDLITLMPDSQTQEIVDYILELREIRRKRAALVTEDGP